MDTKNEDYKVSFFRPTNEHAKANRNMVLLLVVIWAVAVFGFQAAMRIIQEPTPEPALTSYYDVKHVVLSEEYVSAEQKQVFVKSITAVLGKAYLRDLGLNKVNKENYPMFRNILGWAVYSIIPDSVRAEYKTTLVSFNKAQDELATLLKNQKIPGKKLIQKDFEKQAALLEGENVEGKAAVKAILSPYMGLIIGEDPMAEVMHNVIYAQIKADHLEQLPEEYISKLDGAMNFYLIHNQSVLTDTKFLGFPFHYFYSAVFLLVLFVFLCWVYAWRTERINKKFGVED